MNNTQKNLQDAEVAVQSHLSIHALLALKGPKGISRDDSLCFIQLEGGNTCLCGKDGRQAIARIIRREYDTRKEINTTVPESEFASVVTKQFALNFFVNKKPITESSLAKTITDSHKKIRSQYQESTHFIPCYLFHHTEPKEFDIGGVRFIHSSIFEEEYGTIFRQHFISSPKTSKTPSKGEEAIIKQVLGKKWAGKSQAVQDRHLRLNQHKAQQKLLSLYKKSFLDYNWIAVIKVAPCQKDRAKQLAETACEQALNVLRLILHEPYNERLRLSFDSRVSSETLRLTLNGEEPHYIHSSGGVENIQDGWYPYIWSDDGKHFISIFSSVIANITQLEPHAPLKERLHDALIWYGQALSETAPGVKVVKLISAIERLTLTGEEIDISEIVTGRAASLLKAVWREDQKDALKKYYKLRSKLVHGEKSPHDYNITRDLFAVSTLCRKTILAAADFYNAIGLDKKLTRKQLSKYYDSIEKTPKE